MQLGVSFLFNFIGRADPRSPNEDIKHCPFLLGDVLPSAPLAGWGGENMVVWKTKKWVVTYSSGSQIGTPKADDFGLCPLKKQGRGNEAMQSPGSCCF